MDPADQDSAMWPATRPAGIRGPLPLQPGQLRRLVFVVEKKLSVMLNV